MSQAQAVPPSNSFRRVRVPSRRRRDSRSEDEDLDSQAPDDHADGDIKNGDNTSNSDAPSRKRRRSRKGLDKKFDCPQEGCGKSYSRAEHLYAQRLPEAFEGAGEYLGSRC